MINHRLPSIVPFALLFTAALLLYLSFQSICFDDFDSLSFALALDHFDLALQQPHPPGFPVYVAAGRLVYAITRDRLTAFTVLSAISGAAGVAALAWLGMEAKHRRAGWLAALWLMTLPIFWLSSEIALSDVPGVALVLLTVTCLWKGRCHPRWLIMGAGLAGVCLGLRPQNAIPVALFGAYACFRLARDRIRDKQYVRPLSVIGVAVAVGLIAVLLWLIPTANASGGWDAYWSAIRAHSNHIMQIDSLVGRPVTGAVLTARLGSFGQGVLALFGGAWIGLVVLVVWAFGFIFAPWRSPLVRLCAVWLLLMVAQVFLFESLERPRLYLPFIPPLVLLAAMGWTRVGFRRDSLRTTCILIPLSVVFLLAAISLPLAITLTREAAPPIQATQYVAAHYPVDHSLVVTMGSIRAAQIGLPAYPQLYLGQFDAVVWAKVMTDRQPTNLILLDRDDIWPEAYAALTESGDYVPIEDRLFSRDPRVFPQHSLLRLQVLTPIRLLSPAQLALPASGEIQIGESASGKYLGEGWYRPEEIGGSLARWTQQTAEIRVALPPADTTLTIEAAPYPADQSIEVSVNGQSIGVMAVTETWKPLSIVIPARVLAGYPMSTITLRHARADTPPGSTRSLAVAYRLLRLSP